MSPGEASKFVASEIESAMISSFSLSSRDVSDLFLSLSSRLAGDSRLSPYRDDVLRRLSEAEISIYFSRDDAFEYFKRSWEVLESAGFVSLERKATVLAYRIMWSSRRGDREDVLFFLDELGSLVEHFSDVGENHLAEHFGGFISGVTK